MSGQAYHFLLIVTITAGIISKNCDFSYYDFKFQIF